MKEWNKIFKINKELDEVFKTRYSLNHVKFYEKNVLELMSEIAELANETKCFKYWSIKEPNKEKVLEEYADAITMCLSLFTTFDIELINIPEHVNNVDILDLFNELLKDSVKLYECRDSKLVKMIFSNLLYLRELLGYTIDELYEACYKKMKIIEERLNTNY